MKNQFLLDRYNHFLKNIDIDSLMSNTEALYKLEYCQNFRGYHASADKTVELLKAANIPNIEKLTFPADGKTAYQDKITPLGWDVTTAKLTVKRAVGLQEGFAIADYERCPFELIKGSVGTAPEGMDVTLVDYQAMLAGANVKNALVVAPTNVRVGSSFITACLDLGAIGYITDFAKNDEDEPYGVQWCNAYTEHNGWHVIDGERDFIAFSIQPAIARKLRCAMASGPVICHLHSDARRFETTVDVVTACIPGRSSKEFWMLAHLYEPLSNDNSSGVAAVIETAKAIMQQGTPDYSLRMIFGLEYYGFAAYAAHRSNESLTAETIGGCNFDAMYLRREWNLKMNTPGPGTPFYGNIIMKVLTDTLAGEPGIPDIKYFNSYDSMYDDDTFLTDPTVGVPVMWPIRQHEKARWHNSVQVMDYLHADAFAVGTAINMTLVDACVNPNKEVIRSFPRLAEELMESEVSRAVGSVKEHLQRRLDITAADIATLSERFAEEKNSALKALWSKYAAVSAGVPDEIPTSPWRDYIAGITVSRATAGFPSDLARIPMDKRRPLPGAVIYGPLASILANMDGKRTLAEAVRNAEHEICRIIPDAELKKLVSAIFYLADCGYLSLNGFRGITKSDIVEALRQAGVKEGDFLLVHSSLSVFGYLNGGSPMVIEALKEAVGAKGTFLLPVLRNCFANIGGPNTAEKFRPYKKSNINAVWTGLLPRTFLEENPAEPFSNHITHAWCGWGAQAAEACAAHSMFEAPCSDNSPMKYALDHNAKIVHLGSHIGSTTFLHYLEDKFDLPGLSDILCVVSGSDDIPYNVAVPRNLPGCREFYRGEGKFFSAAAARGLEIKTSKLALGTVQVLDMQTLYNIGSELVKNDPFIFLHDEGTCANCDYWRKLYIQNHKQQ